MKQGTSRRPRRRYDAILDAEVRRLAREVRGMGPMPRAALARRAGSSRWPEGTLDAAVEKGVIDGKLRRLPFDFIAPVERSDGAQL